MTSSSWISRLKSEWLTLAGGLIGLLIGILSIFAPFGKDNAVLPSLAYQEEVLKIHKELQGMSENVNNLKAQLDTLSQIPDESKFAIQLRDINTVLTDLKSRQSKLEEVIMSNPAKAIEVPLLRKDLDSLKDAQQQNLLALRQGVDQVYDLNKWLLGAMAVSIVTLAISNLMKGREKEKPEAG